MCEKVQSYPRLFSSFFGNPRHGRITPRKLIDVRILLTAFEPYDHWSANSSWLTLVELLKDFQAPGKLVTRRYPVHLNGLCDRLAQDLKQPFDVVLHLGQSPGASAIKLESIALNAAGCIEDKGEELAEIIPSGPLAFRSAMPLARWVKRLRSENIPCGISYHAGTYLCNAAMYLSHYFLHTLDPSSATTTRVGFVHLPLTTEQIAQHSQALPSLPVSVLARGVRLMLDDILQTGTAIEKDQQVVA